MAQELLFNNDVKNISINNRRYLGNKYRLLPFIDNVLCGVKEDIDSLADIFAGTGVVAHFFSKKQIITNDILYSNYLCHVAWFFEESISLEKITDLCSDYNRYTPTSENYMSKTFSNTYFGSKACRKIGYIREDIERLYKNHHLNFRERAILVTSLIYAMDKIANTCGHYDAYRRTIVPETELELRVPNVSEHSFVNRGNLCFHEDANALVRKIHPDMVYIDPPYNSRQYCDSYHVLENVACWEKPEVFGVARKMDRENLKSRYCSREAAEAFQDLIENIQARFILVSYNNMANHGDERSNARITDEEILSILSQKGKVKTFSARYKAFSAGKSYRPENEERLFLVSVQ
ncbi:MAG: DNA adenine methylase [Planctomycetia bacterium]|nr:DNA adenine methylase [Planctomycetia bacterium]